MATAVALHEHTSAACCLAGGGQSDGERLSAAEQAWQRDASDTSSASVLTVTTRLRRDSGGSNTRARTPVNDRSPVLPVTGSLLPRKVVRDTSNRCT